MSLSTMSSTDNPPSLALSDIMYHMSPSPAPPDEHHGLGASGSTQDDFGSGDGLRDTFISSEVKSSQDVAGIGRRLTELGFLNVGQLHSLEKSVDFVANPDVSPREKELLDMVISLSQAVAVDPTQLERQAETIANLTTHRDFLAEQIEEERERWQSERESWDRTAEALLTLRSKPSKSEDIERVRASYESENRMLRVKLQDSQKRQQLLESELTRLKPLLFLQPFSISRHDKGKGREFVPKSSLNSIPEDIEMRETQDKTAFYHNHQSRIHQSPATPSTPRYVSTTQTTPTPLPPRRTRDHSHYHKSSSSTKRHCQTLTSDAYTEHLLLAAKKIGRKRAAVVTGIIQHAEREKEVLVYEQEQIRSQKEQDRMEQDRQERIASGAFGAYYRTGPGAEASTSTSTPGLMSSPQRGRHSKTTTPVPPRTPKRNHNVSTLHYPQSTGSASANINNSESSLVYVNVNTATSSYDSPWAGSGVMGTPGQIKSALNRQNGRAHAMAMANIEKGGGNIGAGSSSSNLGVGSPSSTNMGMSVSGNPTTPLASLLDAALMMNEDGPGGTPRSGTAKQKGRMNGKGRPLEDPESPLPKRRRTSTNAPSGGGKLVGMDRVKSALDVLADQADQASAAVAFNDANTSAADKAGKEKDQRHPSHESQSNGNAKGKGKAKAKDIIHHPLDHDQNEDKGREDTPSPPEQSPNGVSRANNGKGLIFVTSTGRGRPRRESSATTTKTAKGKAPATTGPIATTSALTSRPVRQAAASRKQATSPEVTTTRTSARTRAGSGAGAGGRATRGSTSNAASRSVGATAEGSLLADGSSRMISPPGGHGLRVIAPGPGYSKPSLEEGLMLSKSSKNKITKGRNKNPDNNVNKNAEMKAERDKIEDGTTATTPIVEPKEPEPEPEPERRPPSSPPTVPEPLQTHSSPQSSEPKESTPKTVASWGIRNPPTVEEPSSSLPIRGVELIPSKPQDSNPPELFDTVLIPQYPAQAKSGKQEGEPSGMQPASTEHVNPDSHEQSLPPSLPLHNNVDASTSVEDPESDAPVGADDVDEDPDAEGDQEDGEGEDEDADADADSDSVSAKHTSRSKSPPPPDPPPPGPDNGSPPDQQDDHDTDADAEGEMDIDEDAEDPSPPSTGSGTGVGMTSALSFSSSCALLMPPTITFDCSSLNLPTTFFSFVICFVTPSFHYEVPTPLSSVNPSKTLPQMFPDISEDYLFGKHMSALGKTSTSPSMFPNDCALPVKI